ncbi:MAG TPA: GRP family sugar transporter [Bryobacteraceae bacterium]|jgi:glucose uptake protein
MIIPSSYVAVLILLLAGMVAWGTWANLFKAAGGKWRFELFYFDFAVGVLVAAAVLALTAGSLGFDGFSLMDDLQLAGKKQDLFGFAAGAIFNLGNMLLLAAVSLAGMAVAFPAAMGFALIVAGLWNFSLNPGGNVKLLIAGAAVVAGAIALDILAFRGWSAARLKAQAEAGTAKPKKRKAMGMKGIFLSLGGGLLLGSFVPLIEMGRAGENGLGPYSIGFIFAIGVLFSTFVFNLFFMNLPVQGSPIEIREYFRAKGVRHVLGIVSGIVWYVGMIASLIVGRVEGKARVSAPVTYMLEQGGIVIAALCGIFLWKEYAGADSTVRIRLGLMFVLLLAGIGLLGNALGVIPS